MFEEALKKVKESGKLLARTDGGEAEVYEVNDRLLVVVDYIEKEFWTKEREKDPIGYEEFKKELEILLKS